jgi:hypothetical protein
VTSSTAEREVIKKSEAETVERTCPSGVRCGMRMNWSKLGEERDELGRVKVIVGESGSIGSVKLKADRIGFNTSDSGSIS